MESVRKDIEYCFGIIKGRWRLFKGGILFNTREKIDNAWFTACILHNMLHKVKRLDEMEEDADWVGSAGEPFTNAEVSMAMDGDGDAAAPGFEAFRARLVAHFKYVWDKKQVLCLRGRRCSLP